MAFEALHQPRPVRMNTFFSDLRFGARILRKNPSSTAFSVVALALGIGLTAMMFSIVYGAILRGLPFPDAEQIMHLERSNLSADISSMEVTMHDFADWRAQQTSFEDLGAYYTGTVNVSIDQSAERYDGAFITPSALAMLRITPFMGRLMREEELQPGAEPVILLAHNVWRDNFRSDPNIIGSSIRANGRPTTVIGVMPEGFHFPTNQDVWVPLPFDLLATPRGEGRTLEVVGRLKEGVSVDAAMVELSGIAKRLEIEYPETNRGIAPIIQPFVREYIGAEPIALLYTMLGAVFFVLLIACANVANLLMSRAATRSKEVGIRTALGASKMRIVRQFLSEAVLLSLAGAAAGIAVAWLGIRLFNIAIVDAQPPFWIDIRIDPVVLTFVTIISLAAAFLSGLIPALNAARANVNDILKDESRGSSSFSLGRISKGIVVFEIALSCGLLIASGLMIKSVTQLRTIDYGFPTENVFTARIGLPEAEYSDPASQVRFFDELLPRLQALPAASSAALTSVLPGLYAEGANFTLEGETYLEDRDVPIVRLAAVSPSYFDALSVQLRQGRVFTDQDREGALPVVIVNESFARRYFPDGDALGKRLQMGGRNSEQAARTIVGIAPDLFMSGVDNEDPEGIYVPFAQSPRRFASVLLPARGEPLALTPDVRAAVLAIDSDLPIYFVDTLAKTIAQENWFYGVFGSLFMIFGFVALFLAGIGLYGVMATSVTQRTREMGVRMALGAQARDVLRLVMRQGLVQLAIGLVLGLGLALGLGNLLTIALFNVNPRDPMVFITIILFLSAAASLACFIPARRATRVDPMTALKD